MKVFNVLLILFSVGTLFAAQSLCMPSANAAANVFWIDIPTADSLPSSIVSMPGGFAFTERQGNKIGLFSCLNMTGNCSLTEFPVPTPQSEPLGIAFGVTNATDMTVWFTEFASKKIGRMVPTRQSIQELDLNLAGSPRFLSVAKDGSSQLPLGDVWFTESAASLSEPPFSQSGAIWRVNPTTLAATRYAIPKYYADPWGIAVSSDGTAWARDGQDLLKVSEASGVVAVYPIPWWTNENVAVDPRSGISRVWLTGSAYSDSYLVSFDASTLKFTRIDIAGFAGADNLAVDDDGNVWFASSMTGEIATFRPEEGSMSLFNLGLSEGVRVIETTHDARFPVVFATGNRIGILSAIYGERSTTTSSFPSAEEGAFVATTWTDVTTTLPAFIVYQTTTTVSTSATRTITTVVYVGGCTPYTVTTSVTATVYGSTTTALQTTTATEFEIRYTSTRVAWTGTNYEYQGTMTIPTTTETVYASTTTATTTEQLTVTGTCTFAYRTVTVATTTVPDTLTLSSCVSTVTVTNPTLTPASETASVSATTPNAVTVISTSLQQTAAPELMVVHEYSEVTVIAFIVVLIALMVLRRQPFTKQTLRKCN